jgi:hypothetical protein
MAFDNNSSVEINTTGLLQFRAFVYAVLTVFREPHCDAMSVSVMAFLMSSQPDYFQAFDATNNLLPMCNDASDTGWKCKCNPVFSISQDMNVAFIDNKEPITANAICNAISMINKNDIEKINAFALLGGIVDFARIPNGVYTSVIMDNSAKLITDSIRNMKYWKTNKFDVWKKLLEKNSSSLFRRPNYEGHLQPDQDIENKSFDPICETVFVQTAALVKLFKKATNIFVVFLRPDFSLSKRTSQCRINDTIGTCLSESICLTAVENGTDDRHRYWKNRNACRCKG